VNRESNTYIPPTPSTPHTPPPTNQPPILAVKRRSKAINGKGSVKDAASQADLPKLTHYSGVDLMDSIINISEDVRGTDGGGGSKLLHQMLGNHRSS